MHPAFIGIAGNNEPGRRIARAIKPPVTGLIGQRHFKGVVLMAWWQWLSIANSQACKKIVPLQLDVFNALTFDVFIAADRQDKIVEREDCLPSIGPLRPEIVPDVVIHACEHAAKTSCIPVLPG